MYYVYILRSIAHPKQTYIGYTHDLKTRLAQHNAGKSAHTSKFAPWALASYIAFPDESLAIRMEKYLKSGSGHSFAKRHLLAPKPGTDSKFTPEQRQR
ncbi:MAG: GIY-YIG nuclease family protein [Acidobacteriota bacterium]|nr:GIY-YIG nuclease family protein [Acidobacteriota bacterium]